MWVLSIDRLPRLAISDALWFHGKPQMYGHSIYLAQNHKLVLVGVKLVRVPICLKRDAVSGRDDLGMHGIRLRAAQSCVGPVDCLDRLSLDLVCRYGKAAG
jgi:hypothetical protein